jgi:RHS repeat-associated protein
MFSVGTVRGRAAGLNAAAGSCCAESNPGGMIIPCVRDSGGTLAMFSYQAFGENPSLTSGGYRYIGRRLDPEALGSSSQPSGLYYYRARMYAPGWGRFMQPDPTGWRPDALHAQSRRTALLLKVRLAQIADVPAAACERAKSTHSCPSRQALRTGGERERADFGGRRRLRERPGGSSSDHPAAVRLPSRSPLRPRPSPSRASRSRRPVRRLPARRVICVTAPT